MLSVTRRPRFAPLPALLVWPALMVVMVMVMPLLLGTFRPVRFRHDHLGTVAMTLDAVRLI